MEEVVDLIDINQRVLCLIWRLVRRFIKMLRKSHQPPFFSVDANIYMLEEAKKKLKMRKSDF